MITLSKLSAKDNPPDDHVRNFVIGSATFGIPRAWKKQAISDKCHLIRVSLLCYDSLEARSLQAVCLGNGFQCGVAG